MVVSRIVVMVRRTGMDPTTTRIFSRLAACLASRTRHAQLISSFGDVPRVFSCGGIVVVEL